MSRNRKTGRADDDARPVAEPGSSPATPPAPDAEPAPPRPHRPPPGPRIEARDLDRIREKVTFAFEPAQVILLLLGLFILLGLAFVAGMVVGHALREPPIQAADVDALVAVQGAEALPLRASDPATAPIGRPRGATTGSVLPRPAGNPPAARGPDGEIAPSWERRTAVELPPDGRPAELAARYGSPRRDAILMARPAGPRDLADDAPAIAARRGDVEVPRPAGIAFEPWPSTAVTDPVACVSCVAPDGECGPELPPPAPEPRPADDGVEVAGAREAAEPPPEARPAPEPAREAAAGRARPEPERKAESAAEKPARAETPYEVQVKSCHDEAEAKAYAAELAGKGYKTRVVPYTDDAGSEWYRVRLGRFPSAARASEFAKTLNAKEGTAAIPVAVPGAKP